MVGSWPARARSSNRLVNSTRRCTGFCTTCVPTPRLRTSRPLSTSSWMARRVVGRDSVSRLASASSFSKRSPGPVRRRGWRPRSPGRADSREGQDLTCRAPPSAARRLRSRVGPDNSSCILTSHDRKLECQDKLLTGRSDAGHSRSEPPTTCRRADLDYHAAIRRPRHRAQRRRHLSPADRRRPRRRRIVRQVPRRQRRQRRGGRGAARQPHGADLRRRRRPVRQVRPRRARRASVSTTATSRPTTSTRRRSRSARSSRPTTSRCTSTAARAPPTCRSGRRDRRRRGAVGPAVLVDGHRPVRRAQPQCTFRRMGGASAGRR